MIIQSVTGRLQNSGLGTQVIKRQWLVEHSGLICNTVPWKGSMCYQGLVLKLTNCVDLKTACHLSDLAFS